MVNVHALLLVEDEEDAAALVTAHLDGTVVHHARTVNEALGRLAEVDAIVLDLGLPDSQGFDTLAMILEAAPQTPVLVLTGSDDPGLPRQAIEAGAQEFVHKNEINELRSRVDAAILRQRHRNRALAQALTAGIRAANLPESALEPTSPVTLSQLGSQRLKDALPEVFGRLVESYVELVKLAMESRTYASVPRPVTEAKAFIRDIALLNAAPRDAIDVHLAALDTLSDRTHPERLAALADEGRIVLLETLGYLALHYRDHIPGRGVS